ncbi:MAG: hypothetical protein P4L67_05440 [Candidatus Pacebacteria bacterium]|nr:hypothetical protein [Candidatus Paceibacterota bacterium]
MKSPQEKEAKKPPAKEEKPKESKKEQKKVDAKKEAKKDAKKKESKKLAVPEESEPEAPEEEKKEEKKLPPPPPEPRVDYLKLTSDFKAVVRAELTTLKEAKTQTELFKTKALEATKKREKQERELQKQKFTKFKKKSPFLKAVQTQGYFHPEKEKTVVHGPYNDGMATYKLTSLDRVWAPHSWKPAATCMDVFHSVPMQKLSHKARTMIEAGELKYQELLKQQHDVYRNQNDGTLKKTILDTKLAEMKVWKPTKVQKELFTDVKPLNDGTMTPRERARKLSPARAYEKKVWNPPRASMDYFGDKKRGRVYK